jgi:hypothetical protein
VKGAVFVRICKGQQVWVATDRVNCREPLRCPVKLGRQPIEYRVRAPTTDNLPATLTSEKTVQTRRHTSRLGVLRCSG